MLYCFCSQLSGAQESRYQTTCLFISFSIQYSVFICISTQTIIIQVVNYLFCIKFSTYVYHSLQNLTFAQTLHLSMYGTFCAERVSYIIKSTAVTTNTNNKFSYITLFKCNYSLICNKQHFVPKLHSSSS